MCMLWTVQVTMHTFLSSKSTSAKGFLLLFKVCASLEYQREAVTHLAEAGGVWGMFCSEHKSDLFIQLITYSPVQMGNEPNKSILFYAKYHLMFLVLAFQLLERKIIWLGVIARALHHYWHILKATTAWTSLNIKLKMKCHSEGAF